MKSYDRFSAGYFFTYVSSRKFHAAPCGLRTFVFLFIVWPGVFDLLLVITLTGSGLFQKFFFSLLSIFPLVSEKYSMSLMMP